MVNVTFACEVIERFLVILGFFQKNLNVGRAVFIHLADTRQVSLCVGVQDQGIDMT